MARSDTSELLDAIEESLHQIAVFVDMTIIGFLFGVVAARGQIHVGERGRSKFLVGRSRLMRTSDQPM